MKVLKYTELTMVLPGYVAGDIRKLNPSDVSDLIGRGGTFLYSARYPEIRKPRRTRKRNRTIKEIGIEGLVVIGGDGSYQGAVALTKLGFPTVGFQEQSIMIFQVRNIQLVLILQSILY